MIPVQVQLSIYRYGESGLTLQDALAKLGLDAALADDEDVRVAHAKGRAEGTSKIRAALLEKAQRGDPWASRELRLLDRRSGVEDEAPPVQVPDWSPNIIESIDSAFALQVALLEGTDEEALKAKRRHKRIMKKHAEEFERRHPKLT